MSLEPLQIFEVTYRSTLILAGVHHDCLLFHECVGVNLIRVDLVRLVSELVDLVLHLCHLDVIVVWHGKPGVLQHLLSGWSIFRVPFQDLHQEVAQDAGFSRL